MSPRRRLSRKAAEFGIRNSEFGFLQAWITTASMSFPFRRERGESAPRGRRCGRDIRPCTTDLRYEQGIVLRGSPPPVGERCLPGLQPALPIRNRPEEEAVRPLWSDSARPGE